MTLPKFVSIPPKVLNHSEVLRRQVPLTMSCCFSSDPLVQEPEDDDGDDDFDILNEKLKRDR